MKLKGSSVELKSNILAALIGANNQKNVIDFVAKNEDLFKTSFEFTYNASCAMLLTNDYDRAKELLEKALGLNLQFLKRFPLDQLIFFHFFHFFLTL
jgi:TolA-binding protein